VDAAGIAEESLLNFVASDGRCLVACRYGWAGRPTGVADGSDDQGCSPDGPFLPQATLYLATGTQWAASDEDPPGMYRMRQADRRLRMAILSSEPLTSVREEWLPIPRNTFVVCTRTLASEGHGRVPSGTLQVLLLPFDYRSDCPRGVSTLAGLAPSAERIARESESQDWQLLGDGCRAGRAGGGCGETAELEMEAPTALPGLDVFANEHSGIGNAPVLCVAAVPPFGVLAAGSQDGGLRFFGPAEPRRAPELRRHSGPILSLLVSEGPGETGEPFRTEGRSVSPTRERSPGIPADLAGCARGLPRISSAGSLAAESEDTPTTPRSPKYTASQLWGAPGMLLFSAGTNEMRVWDVSICTSRSAGPWPEIVCLFCFRFTPNQGRLLSLAGDCRLLFLGFQSTRLFALSLADNWRELVSMKSKSRSIRFLTFDLARTAALEPAGGSGVASPVEGRALGRFCHHACLVELSGPGPLHYSGIHALAYHERLRTLVSAGSDGILNFLKPSKADSTAAPGALQLAARYCEGQPIFALALDEFTEELFAGDAAGQIRVWGLRGAAEGAGRKTALGPPLRAAILALQLGPAAATAQGQCRWLYSGDTEGRVCVWDVLHGVLLQALSGTVLICCGALCCLSSGNDGAHVRLACGGTAGGVHIFGGDAKGVLQSLTLHDYEAPQSKATSSSQPTQAGKAVEAPALSPTLELAGPSERSTESESALLTSLLRQFVAIRSHAGRPDELHRAACWLRGVFERLLGASVRVCSDGTVLARCGWEVGRPLLALYSHYDVVAARDDWTTNPWELTGRDGKLFGRGATDCKGPILAQIFAARRLLLAGQTHTSAYEAASEEFYLSGLGPEDSSQTFKKQVSSGHMVNLLFIVDAAEESGSPGLLNAVREAREQGWLGAPTSSVSASAGAVDSPPAGLLVTNSTWIDDEHPCICYGMRGVLDLHVKVSTGGKRDVHSGYAGLFSEPFLDLASLLSSLIDASGRVSVPGFEDRVRPLCSQEMKHFEHVVSVLGEERLSSLLQECMGREGEMPGPGPGAPAASAGFAMGARPGTMSGVEALRRSWVLPALSVTALSPGAGREEGRLISKEATAVISIRTVPNQVSAELTAALKAHLLFEFGKRRTSNELEVTEQCAFGWWEGCPRSLEDSGLFRSARRGVQEAWALANEEEVLAVREGGTMPMLAALQAELGCEAVQIPLGQASDAAHLPDERIAAWNLLRGVDAIWRTMLHVGGLAA